MNFLDIASIVFVCTAANHLGPIPDIEAFIRWKLPVIGCIKCLTFWSVLVYGLICCDTIAETIEEAPRLLAISFLSAWSAIWLDIFMGVIDKLYLIIYEQIYPTEHQADTDEIGAADSLSDVPGEGGCDAIAGNHQEEDH